MKRLLILLICALLAGALQAADKDRSVTVSPRVYKQLSKAEKLIADKSYGTAQQVLQKLLREVDSGDYEQAAVLRSLSSVYALQNQYGKAADMLEQCLALKALPETQAQQAVLNLGQLYLATEQYAKAVKIMQPLLARNPKPDAELSAMMANAYVQLKQYRQALPHIQKAIASTNKPVESWYQLNLALYYELKDYKAAAGLLQRLIRRYPEKKDYWDQLASVYLQVKNHKKAVSIQHLAYKKGLLTSEKELLNMVNLFLYVGSPYKAAKILADALNNRQIRSTSANWEILANAWQQARELDKAIRALETASQLNEKGRLYQQLGQIYVEQEQWQKAVTAFDNALIKGGLKQPGLAYLLQGMSHYELGNQDRARQAFSKAAKYSKQKKSAAQWLDYLNEKN
jgi:tetratricopeptide (TPR) repeat protein